MKIIHLDNSELLSIVMEALASSHACALGDDDCSVNNNWKISTSKTNPSKLSLQAEIWEPLSKYSKKGVFDYQKSLRLAICLGEQLTALSEVGYGITHIDPKDIMVINENWYLLTNFSNIAQLNVTKSTIKILSPISKSMFVAPEIKNIKTLPFETDQSCSYYSVALLCLHVLGLNKTAVDIKRLFPSSLYFFMERCLHEDPKKRVFLLV